MHLHIARDGQQLGVFAEADVQSRLATGQLLPDDLFWAEGMADWQPLRTRFGAALTMPGLQPTNPYATPQASIITPAMTSRHNMASQGARLGARLLDGLLAAGALFLPVMAGAFVMAAAEEAAKRAGTEVEITPAAAACFIAGAVAFLGVLIYDMVLLGTRGQTIAKRWLKIRIVNFADGQNPGFAKAFLLRSFVNGLIGAVVPFYSIVDICFIFRADQRCIHDLMADTVVVSDKA